MPARVTSKWPTKNFWAKFPEVLIIAVLLVTSVRGLCSVVGVGIH